MSHRAGRPRLVLAAVAAVVGTLSSPSRSPLAAQSSSQDTTGHGAGWGIVYSSPRSRQTAAHQVTATPATPQAAAASAPQSAPAQVAPVPSAPAPVAATSTGSAAAGWANGAAPAGNGAANTANAPALTGRAYAGDPPAANTYNPAIVSQNNASASAAAASQPPAPPAYAGRVPGVIYSSNGGVYPPPARYTAAPAADPPATTTAAPPAYTAQSYPAQAPAQTYNAAPTQAYGAPAAAANNPAPAYSAAPAPAYGPPAYPAPSYAAPAYPAPSSNGATANWNTTPADRPTNLPPNGKTDASYDAPDTNPPPGAAAGQAPVSASSIHLDELMSLHEWESSGVSRLRPQEIAVLEKWIERYRQQVADSVTRTLQSSPRGPAVAAAAPLPPISRAADGTPRNAHAVVAIRSGSRYITLDDGSVWDVYTSDQTETAAWQQGDLIQVRVAPVAYGEFDHELVNNQRTGPVRAKFMGYAAKQ